MLKIKLMGKHLVAIALLFVIAAALLYAAGPHMLYAKAENLGSQGKSREAQSYYDLTAKFFPYSDEGIRALFFSAQQDIYSMGDVPGLIMFFPASTGSPGEHASEKQTKRAIAKFELVCHRAPDSPWAKHALREMGKAYYALGDAAMAIKYLELSVEESEMQAAESTELLASIYLEEENTQKALELVEKSLEKKPGLLTINMMFLKGRALMALGELESARQVFTSIAEQAKTGFTEIFKDQSEKSINLNTEHWENAACGYLKKLEALAANKNELGNISGRVYLGDFGSAGTYVYLIDLSVNPDYYTGSTSELTRITTDENGSFEFFGLLPGKYALGVGIRSEKVRGYVLQKLKPSLEVHANKTVINDIHFVPAIKLKSPAAGIELEDQIVFTWETVEGADTYGLFIGPVTRDETGTISGTYTTELISKIENNEIVLNIDKEIAESRFGQSIAYYDGEISPLSLLGLLYYGGEYTWGVNAYDQEGNLLTSSAGCGVHLPFRELPLFKITEKKMSEGDRLLLEKKFAEAKKAYLQVLEDDPFDNHALLLLARMNHFGTTRGAGNPSAAITYYERLWEIEDIPEVKKALADVYYETAQLNKAYELYYSLQDTKEDSWLIHARMARIKIRQGKIQEGLSQFRQAVQMENGLYVRAYPVIVSLLLDDVNNAVWFANKVDQGDTYLHLLKTYQEKGLYLKPEIKELIANGDYTQAADMPANDSHDLLIKGFLYYITSDGNCREEINRILGDIKPGFLKELLQNLTR